MNDADLQHWCERAVTLGADAAFPFDPAKVTVSEWVRMKCLYGCDDCGVHKTCPPNAPPLDSTRRLLTEFRSAILLEAGPIAGEENSDPGARALNDAALKLERELFLAGFHKAWMMGAGPCDICSACVDGEDCPTPEKARPSMEGCGVDVFTTVRAAGRQIETVKDRDDEYRFFALVLAD